MRPTVVFDTNILFSWTGWKGAPYHCVEMARRGAIRHVTCQEILEEFSEKLDSKLRMSRRQGLIPSILQSLVQIPAGRTTRIFGTKDLHFGNSLKLLRPIVEE